VPNKAMPYVISTLLCVVLASCSIIGDVKVDNLAFVSVKESDLRNPTDASRSLPSNAPVIVISFTADRDLRKLARQHEFNIGNDAYFCREKKVDVSRPLQSASSIFDSLGKVYELGEDTSRETSDRKGYYEIYISVKSISLAGQNVYNYDLRQDSGDICIEIRGGNMLGGRFASNIILVSKEAIDTALAHR
jgi:hypothetical protein